MPLVSSHRPTVSDGRLDRCLSISTESYNIDPGKIEAAITPRTKASESMFGGVRNGIALKPLRTQRTAGDRRFL
jgi:hypothetical protein